MFAVVSSSRRPSCIAAIARDGRLHRAAPVLGADAGVRGLPAELARRGGSRSATRRRPRRSASRGRRRSPARTSAARRRRPSRPPGPVSSLTVNSSSSPTGEPSTATRWASASSCATAALLSAPRIVSPALSQPPSTSTGSTTPSCGTVSRCAHSSTVRSARPGIRASRLPHSVPSSAAASSSETAKPSASSSPRTRARHRALAPGDARDRAQLGEEVVQAPALDLGRRPHRYAAARGAHLALGRALAGAVQGGARRSRGTAGRGARGAT